MNAPSLKEPIKSTLCLVCSGEMTSFIENIYDDRYGNPDLFAVDRCSKCGFMSTRPRLPESALPALYSTYYPRRNSTAEGVRGSIHPSVVTSSGWFERWLNGRWTAHYEVKPGMRVLDYGCGDCSSLLELKELGAEPLGVEVDPNVRALAAALDVRVHVGTLSTLREPNESFDAVTLSQVIEHHPEPEQLLRDLAPQLRANGLLILTTPNSRSFSRRLTGRRWLHWHIPFHINHFHSGSLRSLLERSGFRIEKIKTFTPVPWWEYQLEMLATDPPKPGAPHPYFTNGKSTLNTSWPKRLFMKIARVAAVITTHLLNIVGWGDSLLVIARKN